MVWNDPERTVLLQDEDISLIETAPGKFEMGVMYEGEFYRMLTLRYKKKFGILRGLTNINLRKLAVRMNRRAIKLRGIGNIGILEPPRIITHRSVYFELVAIVVPLPPGSIRSRITKQSSEEWFINMKKEYGVPLEGS